MDAVSEEESAGTRVVKLVAVVALNSFHSGAKLSTHIGEKVSRSSKRVGF